MVDVGPRAGSVDSAAGPAVAVGPAQAAPPSDAELLRQIALGDFVRFDLFVDRYKQRLVGFIRGRIRDRHQSEDLAQEVFMRVFRAAREGHGIDGNGPLTSWIFTIARHCVADFIRERRRKPLTLATDADHDGGPDRLLSVSGTDLTDPAHVAMAADERRETLRLLGQLPVCQRDVVALKIFGQLTFIEIAEVLGCPVPTVKSRMRYGLAKIGQMLMEARSCR